MPELVQRFVAELERQHIPYCHWKGAAALERAQRGERDLDFLVPREAFERTEHVLVATGFKAARSRFGRDAPGTAHFFGHEPGIERLLHVHLHDRVLSGEDLILSHALPFEHALLASPARAHGVRVPTPALEATLGVLKHAIRWGSLPDAALSWLRPKDERAELARLLSDENAAEALVLVGAYCPALEPATFRACVEALRSGRWRPERLRLSRQVRRALRAHANHGAWGRVAAYARVLAARARRLLDGERRDKALRRERAVRIAFVGGDARARAELVAETSRWLGQAFALRSVRSGVDARAGAGEIVLYDGEPGAGWAPDLRVEVEAAGDRASLRARIWEVL